MLERLSVPVGCEDCDNLAYWSWEKQPMCYAHLHGMAEMNSDNEAAVSTALISPVVTYVTRNTVGLTIYPTTWISAICALLNQLNVILPDLDSEGEICIDLLEERSSVNGTKLVCQGRGYYSLDTTTVKCHAPIIQLARAPVGCMSGFMKRLNDHSTRIRECMVWEHAEEAQSG